MRLDVLLVKRGLFKTRNRAKIAIREGLVKVNGALITKPSKDVDFEAEIEVLGDAPRGYWKLKWIDENLKLFSGKEVVLDLGSSAGGFLMYASEKVRFVYGIEISEEFREVLKEIENRRNVKVFFEDAFKFDVEKLEPVDIILNDLSLPFSSSMKALERFLPKLKKDGKILFVCKGLKRPEFENFKVLSELKSDRNERYYLLQIM